MTSPARICILPVCISDIAFPLSLQAYFYYAGGMLIVGLTGGIGSGKSTVSRLFANLDVPVIDTDVIAHELVAPGQPALAQIADVFGNTMLNSAGELDRDRLRQQVFDDNDKRLALENILHPLIKQSALLQIHQLHNAYCILVVPLLVEKGWQSIVHRILVVDASEELQRQRVKQRNGLPDRELNAIMRLQATREQRLSLADDVIVNNESVSHIEIQVRNLHLKYLERLPSKLSFFLRY